MGAAIAYFLFLKPLSFLPFWILYRLSDILYLIVLYLVPYRKKVVLSNLRNSFSEKDERAIKLLQRKFYRHFCDVIVESIKMFSITKKEVIRRCRLTNPELLKPFYEAGQHLVIVAGHYANWELAAVGFDLQTAHQSVGIYAPLKNRFFNQRIYTSRSRLGMELVAKQNLRSFLGSLPKEPIGLLFASDQSPPKKAPTVYWTTFLNQPTAVFLGAERHAKELNWPVIFFYVRKVKRGYFEFTGEIVEQNPRKTADGEITERHVQMLDALIREHPEYWLWTHKRWKRTPPANLQLPYLQKK